MPLELAFGNSQIGPYISGHGLARGRGLTDFDIYGLMIRGEQYDPYIRFTPEGPKFHPAVAADIQTAIDQQRPASLVVAVLGSYHWIYGVCNEPRAFDFVVPDLPQHPMSPGAELIPYDLVLRRIRGDLDWQFGIVRMVKAICDLPIFHIEAPPPVASADLMLRGVYGHFKEKMDQFGYPSTAFRYKMWWVWVHLAKHFCAELGDRFVEGPPETRDADGFLHERYYLDGVHGNDEYGALMVGAVAKARRRLGLGD
jgi:hypothetical protein